MDININKIDILPDAECPFNAPLDLGVQFTASEHVDTTYWNARYVVDHSFKRHIIELASTPLQAITKGENAFKLAIPSIDLKDVDVNVLANIGMIYLTLLKVGDGATNEIIQISLVTDVKKKDGKLVRIIYNPLA